MTRTRASTPRSSLRAQLPSAMSMGKAHFPPLRHWRGRGVPRDHQGALEGARCWSRWPGVARPASGLSPTRVFEVLLALSETAQRALHEGVHGWGVMSRSRHCHRGQVGEGGFHSCCGCSCSTAVDASPAAASRDLFVGSHRTQQDYCAAAVYSASGIG